MKRATLWMIGGGVQQVRAVERARAQDFRIVVSDRNPAAPAARAAERQVEIDGRDVETLVAFGMQERAQAPIDGIFTLTELVTPVAVVANALQWPGVPPAAAVACQNKILCKQSWLSAGIETPRGAGVRDAEDAENWFRALGEDVFVKPAVGFGGKGAGRVRELAQLAPYTAALGHSPHAPHAPLLIEERLTGSMHDANGLIDEHGRFHPLGIIDRRFLEDRPVECEVRAPTELSAAEQAELYALLERGVRALGIHWGPVKADAVRTEQGFRLLEVAPRLHGPRCSLYALPGSGFDPLSPALHAIAGRPIPPALLELAATQCCLGRALFPKPGQIERIAGVDEAQRIEGVESVHLYVAPGTRIAGYDDSSQVAGYVFTVGQNWARCEEAMARAEATIRFEMET